MTTKKDIANQIAFAEKKGDKNASLRIAKSLLDQGVDVDIIVKSTGLSQKDVMAL